MGIFSTTQTTAQQLATIRANQTQTIIPDLALILANQGKIMSALTDLQAAADGVKAAVATAVTLIQSLHTSPPGTVTDAEVEAVVAELNASTSSLAGAQPGP